MRITKRQLKRIIKEEKAKLLSEALPPHLQKHFRKDGSSVHKSQIKDVTPAGYGPDEGGSLLDLDDYEILENCVNKIIGYGYTKEDVAQAFNAIMETV